MAQIVRVGVDLSKTVLQIHAVDDAGATIVNRAVSRERFFEWCIQLPEGCAVAMEASSGAHHIGRKLTAFGLDVKIIAAQFVAPYRIQGKTGKNDANDAAAICETASRQHIHPIPINSAEQQAIMTVHMGRVVVRKERTQINN